MFRPIEGMVLCLIVSAMIAACGGGGNPAADGSARDRADSGRADVGGDRPSDGALPDRTTDGQPPTDAQDLAGDTPLDAPPDGPPPGDGAISLDFSCVGMNTPPPPTSQTVSRLVGVINPLTDSVVAGATVDVLDESGAPTGLSGTTSMDGTVTFDIPVGVDGFRGGIRLTGAGHFPVIATLDQAVTQPGANVLAMVTPEQRMTLAQLAGVTLGNDTSEALVLVTDCVGQSVPGATVEASVPGVKIIYVTNESLPDTAGSQTYDTGLVVVGEIPPGPITITARVPLTKGAQPSLLGTFTFTAVNGFVSEGLLQPD